LGDPHEDLTSGAIPSVWKVAEFQRPLGAWKWGRKIADQRFYVVIGRPRMSKETRIEAE
jgi:hypothetical protein